MARNRVNTLMALYDFGPGRHLFLDTAITCPAIGGALNAQPSSAATIGVAASLRAAKKVTKYQPLAESVSSSFKPAVVERFGACCDELVGFIKQLTGDGDRDALRADDYAFSTASRTTYMASLLVFGAVIADAVMVERVIGMDVMDAAMVEGGGRQKGAQGARRPTQRDIEGSGGRFWYEAGM